MESRDFLTSAQQIISGNQEVDYRNAVRRAYYAVFHVCKNLLETLPNSPRQIGTSHQVLIDRLLSHPDKRLEPLGHQLARARDCRIWADYYLNKKFPGYDAGRLLILAQNIFAAVEKYLSASKL